MPEDLASVATNARRSSASAAVEKEGDVMLDADFERLVETVTSGAIADHAGPVAPCRPIRPTSHAIANRTDRAPLTQLVDMEASNSTRNLAQDRYSGEPWLVKAFSCVRRASRRRIT